MPELAEVYFFSKKWEGMLGQTITEVLTHPTKRCFRTVEDPSSLNALIDCSLERIQAHGKQMIFHFTDHTFLGVHLGMTGKLFTKSKIYPPERHDHLALRTKTNTYVFSDYRMFGSIRFHQGEELPAWLADLPVEILSDNFSSELLRTFIKRHQKQTLKGFLLLQHCFPGVGNWMADEVLWRSQLLPNRRVDSLSEEDTKRLYRRLREVCRDAMRVIGEDWGTPPPTWLFTHRWKAGGICPKTKQPLERKTIAGRTTCWSSAWQK